MRQKSGTPTASSEQVVNDIRRATRKQYSAEEKIRIVLDGLRGERVRLQNAMRARYAVYYSELMQEGGGEVKPDPDPPKGEPGESRKKPEDPDDADTGASPTW